MTAKKDTEHASQLRDLAKQFEEAKGDSNRTMALIDQLNSLADSMAPPEK